MVFGGGDGEGRVIWRRVVWLRRERGVPFDPVVRRGVKLVG